MAYNGAERRMLAFQAVPLMIREVYQNYHLPIPPRGMKIGELRFWYDALIPSLIEMQKECKKKNGK